MESMEIAINNMIEEVKKPVDPEAGGSARKAELQSIKQTAIDCKELLVERQKLEQMVKELRENGEIEEQKTIQVALRKGSLSNFSYYAENQTISDDYLNQNFKAIYRSFSSVG